MINRTKRVVHAISGLLLVVSVAVLICLLSAPSYAQSQPQADLTGKNVLILHALESNMPLNVRTDRAIAAALEAGGIGMKNQFFEYLDLQRNPGATYRRAVADMMRLRYAARSIDIIVTIYPEALQFVLDEGRTIFPDAPTVALYMYPGFKPPETGRRIIQHVLRTDMKGTLKSALKLIPTAKHVYVVGGVHPLDKKNETQARLEFKEWEGQLDFHYLSDMSLDEMRAALSSAPPETIVLYMAVTADSTGRTYNPRDVAHWLSQYSTLPLFGLYETILGYGIVGGSLVSYESIGTQAGQMALDIVSSGSGAKKISAILDVQPVPMFDWRQLRRWNLNVDALPKGSIIVNREFTFWDFRYYIILCLALVLAEAALILVLITQRHRKMLAEQSLGKAEEKYRNIFENALEGIFETTPQGQFLTANPSLAKMLGYDSSEEIMSTIEESGRQVWVEPNQRLAYIRLLEEQGVVLGFESQFKRKDGTKIWVSLNSRRVAGPDGRTLFYAGFIEDITERGRAEAALKRSEERLQTLIQESPLAIGIAQRGIIAFVNKKYLEMFGYDNGEEIYGRSLINQWAPESREEVAERVRRLISGESIPEKFEGVGLRKDGSRLDVHIAITHLTFDDGRASIGFLTDITERKRAEEALRESEEKFRVVSENARAVFGIIQGDRFIYANPYLAELSGYRVDEILSMDFSNMIHPDNREEVMERMLKRLAGEPVPNHYEFIMLTKSGESRWLDFSPERIYLNGKPAIIGTAFDITERKHAEAALRESNERFRQVAENVGDFIWEIDAAGLYLYTSPSVKRILGYAPDELVGKMHFYDLFTPEVREELKTAAFEVFATKQPFRAFPNPNLSKDGRVVHLETSGSPVLDAAGNLLGYRGADTDTTERQEIEARMRQAEKMEALGTLTGGVAHDFNNILAAMMGFAELVKGKVPKGSREERHLQMVMDAGLRGRELIKQMLTFSRQTEQEKKPLQLSTIVQETGRFLRASIPAMISIRVNVESESGTVLADPVQIQQVVMNLCTNAAHAMREKGGVIDLRLSDFSIAPSEARSDGMKPGLYIKLVVRDTGIGIPPEVINRIFDPFFTTKAPDEGTGLGLSVAQGIIRQHDGYITVESQPGKGSAFFVYLPKVAEQPRREAASEEPAPTGDERVLLVDDEKALTETGQEFLEGLGYEVTVRNSSVEALKLFTDEPSRFDLIVTDQTMPGITGLELAKACMALRPDIPIILATGFSHLVNATAAREAGIRAMVMKPLTKGELARTVRKALDG